MDRRTFLAATVGSAAVRAVAHAQAPQQISPVPTPRDWSRLEPIAYPDPDIVALDPRFRQYIVGNTRSGDITSARCGPRGRRGTASAAISCGAISPTTCRCAGSRTMDE